LSVGIGTPGSTALVTLEGSLATDAAARAWCQSPTTGGFVFTRAKLGRRARHVFIAALQHQLGFATTILLNTTGFCLSHMTFGTAPGAIDFHIAPWDRLGCWTGQATELLIKHQGKLRDGVARWAFRHEVGTREGRAALHRAGGARRGVGCAGKVESTNIEGSKRRQNAVLLTFAAAKRQAWLALVIHITLFLGSAVIAFRERGYDSHWQYLHDCR